MVPAETAYQGGLGALELDDVEAPVAGDKGDIVLMKVHEAALRDRGVLAAEVPVVATYARCMAVSLVSSASASSRRPVRRVRRLRMRDKLRSAGIARRAS
jgi:hypothetical protein